MTRIDMVGILVVASAMGCDASQPMEADADAGTAGDADTGTTPGNTGAMPAPADRIGIFSTTTNYAELEAESGPLKFHFGSGNSQLFWSSLPVAGDWEADGMDTIGLFDMASQEFRLASQNDSDEAGDKGLGWGFT